MDSDLHTTIPIKARAGCCCRLTSLWERRRIVITERQGQADSFLSFCVMSDVSGLAQVLADVDGLALEPVASTPAPVPRGKSKGGGGGGGGK